MAPHARQKVGAGCFDFVMSKKRRGLLQYVALVVLFTYKRREEERFRKDGAKVKLLGLSVIAIKS
jgi:hypothetical protein